MPARNEPTLLSRRQLVALGIGASAYAAAMPAETHQSTGCKVGEMTTDSARFWLRRTLSSQRLANGIVRKAHNKDAKLLPPDTRFETLEGSATGTPGYMRVVYKGASSGSTPWVDVNEAADYATQVALTGLRAGSSY